MAQLPPNVYALDRHARGLGLVEWLASHRETRHAIVRDWHTANEYPADPKTLRRPALLSHANRKRLGLAA